MLVGGALRRTHHQLPTEENRVIRKHLVWCKKQKLSLELDRSLVLPIAYYLQATKKCLQSEVLTAKCKKRASNVKKLPLLRSLELEI
jgi:hypothetical protein